MSRPRAIPLPPIWIVRVRVWDDGRVRLTVSLWQGGGPKTDSYQEIKQFEGGILSFYAMLPGRSSPHPRVIFSTGAGGKAKVEYEDEGEPRLTLVYKGQ